MSLFFSDNLSHGEGRATLRPRVTTTFTDDGIEEVAPAGDGVILAFSGIEAPLFVVLSEERALRVIFAIKEALYGTGGVKS